MPETVLAAQALAKTYATGEVSVHALRLSGGDQVVLQPSDRITDGARGSER
jgi:hypothetical protein